MAADVASIDVAGQDTLTLVMKRPFLVEQALANSGSGLPVIMREREAAALRDAYFREGDPAKQRDILVRFRQRLWEVMPAIVLGQRANLYGLRKNISGFVRSPSLITPFWNIEKH